MTDFPGGPPGGDAYGQAALTVVESLIHALVSKGMLTVLDAIEILEIAHDAQTAVADDADGSAAPRHAADLIQRMIISLQADLPD